MAKRVEDTTSAPPQKARREVKMITIISKENFDIPLVHDYVCRNVGKCFCDSSRVVKGRVMNVPASIHVVAGIEVSVPEILLREKDGVLVKKINEKKATVVVK